MYLEHVSVVHSVRGDISRIVAPEKPQRWGSWRSLALSLETGRARQVATSQISSHSGRPGTLSAPSTAKASPDRCCSQSVLLCCPPYCPWGKKGWGSLFSTLYAPWQPLFSNVGLHIPKKSNSKSPPYRKTIDIISVASVENTVVPFYLAPLRDVQSFVKGQGDRISASEVSVHEQWYMLWTVLTNPEQTVMMVKMILDGQILCSLK